MKKAIVILVAAVFVISASQAAFAAKTGEEYMKDSADYSKGVVTGSVNTVGEAAKGTVDTAASPLVAFWKSITGQDKDAGKIVTDPVEKGGKTIYDAGVNTGKTITGEKR